MGQPQHRLRVGVYCRISDDREGERFGVERQREDCEARAEHEGWDVVEVFTDNDTGASNKSRKPRPAYKQMLDAAERGELDVILSYSASRLTRRPRELIDLIDLHNATKVRLCTIVSGDANLETADGRAVAITVGAWDAAEAERTGERVARAAKQRREEGKWHGGRTPYGYLALGNGTLGIDPDQATVINEAARRVLAGESLYGVCNDLNRRGILTGGGPRAPQGSGWSARTLKRILTVPGTIGCTQKDDGTLNTVAEPVLDRTTWDRLHEVLYDPARLTGLRNRDWSSRRKFALSGLLDCSLCGHWMSGSTRQAPKWPDGTKREHQDVRVLPRCRWLRQAPHRLSPG